VNESTKCIGTISAVTSTNISAMFNDAGFQKPPAAPAETAPQAPALHDDRGKIGSFVVMPDGNISIIGTIVGVRNLEGSGSVELFSSKAMKRVMEIQPIGTVKNGRFQRGVSSFPGLGNSVFAAGKEDLQVIFSSYRDQNFSLGKLSLLEDERLYVDPNKFFAKHIALFGSTWSGKSCSTASVLQKVVSMENTHVILLDLHGEYEPAFRDQGNVIKITELELPYWLMNFDELVETFVDEQESSSPNQVMVLKDAVLDSKRGKNLGLKEFLTVDTPVYFDFLDVSARFRSLDSERTLGGKEGPFYGQFTRFLVRLESKISDKRYEFLFRPKKYRSSETMPDLLTRLFGLDTGKHVTVVDLSRVPSDVINVLVSLLGRLLFDFNLWNSARQDFPILIVFEEAHTYLSASGHSKAARQTVERIAKEGRKYGVSAMIVSQRPSEISETITAQCNNFIAMRLLNPNDQMYVRKLVPDALSSIIDILPTLQQGEAYLIGDAVAIPSRVMMDPPSPSPASNDIRFYEKWKKQLHSTDVKSVVNNWWKQIRT
jgi:DNA helicase HerA-like ATPase